MTALSNFVTASDALNTTIKAEKNDAFTLDPKIITGTATLSQDQTLTAQAAAAKKALTDLAGVAGANLDAVTGTNLAEAKGTEIANGTIDGLVASGVAGIDVNGVDATKLKNLLADNPTEVQIKAYNDLVAALNSLKEQLNKITVNSSFANLVKNNNVSNIVKSLNEAGLTNFVANNV
ncbi:hypothetical protein, partial [Campylobacter hyointestinalis]